MSSWRVAATIERGDLESQLLTPVHKDSEGVGMSRPRSNPDFTAVGVLSDEGKESCSVELWNDIHYLANGFEKV